MGRVHSSRVLAQPATGLIKRQADEKGRMGRAASVILHKGPEATSVSYVDTSVEKQSGLALDTGAGGSPTTEGGGIVVRITQHVQQGFKTSDVFFTSVRVSPIGVPI